MMAVVRKNSSAEIALKTHPLLARMRNESFDKSAVATILGQWFHPLHYFPVFLSRHIAISPNLAAQTFVSKIVWQELGEGDPRRAHEAVYIETMTDVGFDPEAFVEVPQLPSTRNLLNAYERGSAAEYEVSLGYLFATEAADLAMVGAIGSAVRTLTGARNLPWVDIHVCQEPDHTESVDQALARDLSPAQCEVVQNSAAEMFALWSGFFSGIDEAIGLPVRRTIDDLAPERVLGSAGVA